METEDRLNRLTDHQLELIELLITIMSKHRVDEPLNSLLLGVWQHIDAFSEYPDFGRWVMNQIGGHIIGQQAA